MRCKFLCGLVAFAWATSLSAQSVPARDLWEFPLGSVLEPAALASEPGGGLWNPATTLISSVERWRLGVASLSSASDQSVDGQLIAATFRRSNGVAFGASIARAAVASILRTGTDPQGLGDVPYSSLLASLTAAREIVPHVTAGAAFRYREGRADQIVSHAYAADLGIVVHSLPCLPRPTRASTGN